MNSNSNFIIIIDSREQRPFTFKNIKPDPPAIIVQGLKTGDYSVSGLENNICVERKELGDLFNSVGKGRKRFECEMQRMSEFDYAALVVESDIQTWFMNPPARSKMNPKSVFRTVVAWSQRYNVCVWPMWDRASAEKITYLILERYYDDFIKRKKGA